MARNLRPLSETHPLMVEDEEYERLVRRKEGGWSRCADEKEWLAKLHYLREGFDADKLDKSEFEEREYRLVVGWLKRFIV